MKVTRKGFISSVATAVAATMAPASSHALGFLSPATAADLNTFASQVGSGFEAAGPGGVRASLMLQDLRQLTPSKRIEQFSLLFDSLDPAVLPEGTYSLNHTTLGSMDLFLVPGGKKAALRADFCLLKT